MNAAARVLLAYRDVLEVRPGGGAVPAAIADRGWDVFLLALSEDELAAIEAGGAWPEHTPASLRTLVDEAREATALPSFPVVSPNSRKKLETPRKRAQIDAFAALVSPLAGRATRIVDVGSGHGHLTRELAERLDRPVIGLERDPRLIRRARTLSSAARFAVTDVLVDGLSLARGDCVVGLHACGELGDTMVTSAASADADLALVGCCLQKRRAETRIALANTLELDKRVLGLSNLSAREDGVEATRSENLAARERRLALHRLLSARLGNLRFGAEIDGLNRRIAQKDLATLVTRAFAVRALAGPSGEDVAEAARWAHEHYARARRLSLPRSTLARVLEVFVLLDRARYLMERGYQVRVGTLFPAAVSARNLALTASRVDR